VESFISNRVPKPKTRYLQQEHNIVLQKLARKLEILTAVYWVVCGPNLSNILLPTNPVSKNGQDTGDHLYGKPGNVRDFDSCQ